MSDIELAITRTKTLESLLEQGLGASGKGLHEKVSSVQDRLQPGLVRKLRFIATIRNKIVHEASYQQIDDRTAFVRACDEADAELKALIAPVAQSGCFKYIMIVVGTAVAIWRAAA